MQFLDSRGSSVNKTISCDVLPVHRPLASVSKMVASGHRIIFDRAGSYIEQKSSGCRIPLELRDGVYILRGNLLPFQGHSQRM